MQCMAPPCAANQLILIRLMFYIDFRIIITQPPPILQAILFNKAIDFFLFYNRFQ